VDLEDSDSDPDQDEQPQPARARKTSMSTEQLVRDRLVQARQGLTLDLCLQRYLRLSMRACQHCDCASDVEELRVEEEAEEEEEEEDDGVRAPPGNRCRGFVHCDDCCLCLCPRCDAQHHAASDRHLHVRHTFLPAGPDVDAMDGSVLCGKQRYLTPLETVDALSGNVARLISLAGVMDPQLLVRTVPISTICLKCRKRDWVPRLTLDGGECIAIFYTLKGGFEVHMCDFHCRACHRNDVGTSISMASYRHMRHANIFPSSASQPKHFFALSVVELAAAHLDADAKSSQYAFAKAYSARSVSYGVRLCGGLLTLVDGTLTLGMVPASGCSGWPFAAVSGGA
jgi:hypothetical protein